jgi:hypothetical protein
LNTTGASRIIPVRQQERLSGGRLAVLPVAGPWSAASVVGLVGPLWDSRPEPAMLLAYLTGADPEVPEHEWDVGHFVNVAALISAEDRSLVLVRDSYRGLGWSGYHLQPAEAFAAALERGDGREGGVLCVAATADETIVRRRLAAEGFELRQWDNGTAGITATGS